MWIISLFLGYHLPSFRKLLEAVAIEQTDD